MEVDQLRYFIKVAEKENITRAAEELLISQPALSRAIGRLESELGQPVFERQSRSVKLTDAGRLLLNRAQQIVSLIDDAKAEISDDGETGRVRLAAIPTIAPYFLPRVLKEFASLYPKATLLVQEETTDNILHQVSKGETDLAILALPLDAKYLEYQVLFQEELHLVLPKQHPLTSKTQIRLADIEAYPFILLNEAHCLTDNIVSFCRQKSIQPVSIERANQLATIQELVSLRHGISLIPEMARQLDNSKQRVYRSISPKPNRTIAMLWNPYRFQSKLLLSMRQTLVNYSKTIGT